MRRVDSFKIETTLTAVRQVILMLLGVAALPLLASEPGEEAIEFLEKVRQGEVDLAPGADTALEEQTTEGKRDRIAELLGSLTEQIGDAELKLGEIREDGDYAAVMVCQEALFDPSQLRVFPVAVVKKQKGWVAAPVPASFENSVTAFSLSVKKRLTDLESWMMRQRVLELEKLMASAETRARSAMEEAVSPEAMENDDLVEVLESFRKACFAGSQAEVLARLGGLSKPWPEDWEVRLAAAQVAVSEGSRNEYPWRALVSPEVMRVLIEVERGEQSGLVSMACLDPALSDAVHGGPEIYLVDVRFEKTEGGLWRLDLPEDLLNPSKERGLFQVITDSDLLDEFAQKLRENIGPLIASNSALEAEQSVIHLLKHGSLEDLLQRVSFTDQSEQAIAACHAAAEVWWTTNEPGVFCSPVRLGFREEGAIAVAAYQWFSVKRADRFELKFLVFKKIGEGWVWAPEIELEAEMKDHPMLAEWLDENEKLWSDNWRDRLISSSLRLEEIAVEREVTDEEVRGLLTQWLEVLGEKNVEKALSLTAWSGGEQGVPVKTLRNLAYEFQGAGRGVTEITGIYRSESWLAAGVVRRDGERVVRQFIPVIPTEGGPKILLEVDLIVGSGRSRDFLNNASFQQLSPLVDQKRVEELEGLFQRFQKEVLAEE